MQWRLAFFYMKRNIMSKVVARCPSQIPEDSLICRLCSLVNTNSCVTTQPQQIHVICVPKLNRMVTSKAHKSRTLRRQSIIYYSTPISLSKLTTKAQRSLHMQQTRPLRIPYTHKLRTCFVFGHVVIITQNKIQDAVFVLFEGSSSNVYIKLNTPKPINAER